MMDFEFLYLDNEKIVKTTFQNISSNRRILICSLTRPHEIIADNYAGYLQSKIDFFQQHGIDDVYFVDTRIGKFLLHQYKNRIKQSSIPLLTTSQEFIEYLRDQRSLTEKSLDFLSTFWNFQALFDNGELVHFTDSSVTNPVKDAIKTNPGFMKAKMFNEFIDGKDRTDKGKQYKQANFLTEKPELVLWIPILRYIEWDVAELLFYNHVWPNTSLDKYLIENKTV